MRRWSPVSSISTKHCDRGEYTAFTAEVCHPGMPFDPWAMAHLRQREIRQALRLRLVSDDDLTFGLYDGATLKQARLAEFIVGTGCRGRGPVPGNWTLAPQV